MKFLVIGDIHMDDRSPVNRADDYMESMFAKLEECGNTARLRAVDFVILTGDIFNTKQSSKVSHNLVRRMMETLKVFGCPIYTAVGNHDIVSARLDSLIKQPLGVLQEAGVLQILGTYPKCATISGNVCISAIHGLPNVKLQDYFIEKKPEGCDFYIMVCHSEMLKERMPFLDNQVTFDMLYGSKVDYYVGGHIHDDIGVFKHGDQYFTNIGALSRGSVSEYNLKRKVGILLVEVDFSTGKAVPTFERINLKSALSIEAVFKMKDVIELKRQTQEFDNFAEKLKEEIGQLEYSDIKDLLHYLCKSSNIDEKIYKKALEYLNK